MQTAYRWLREAGEEVVYLIPDGYTKVVQERSGPAATRRLPSPASWPIRKRSTPSASTTNGRGTWPMPLLPREQEGAQTKNMDWDAYIEGLGPRADPRRITPSLEAVGERQQAIKTVKACADASDESPILKAMREYTGPMNKRGRYPKGPFMGLTGKAKRELWDRRNE